MTTPLQLLLDWLAARPRARALVYNLVLAIAVILAVLVWVLPIFDVTNLGPVDTDELGKIAIVTGGLAALLAKLNVPTPDDEQG